MAVERGDGDNFPFFLGGIRIDPGERRTVDLPVAVLSTHVPMTVPVHVVHGRRPGPCLAVSAAVHGDELNGVEIVRRVLRSRRLDEMRGTLIAVPIVNVFGFIACSRYTPDRRDLNRHFPGRPDGALTDQMAHLFVTEVLERATHAIDLHTGAIHRTNVPQVRADLDRPGTRALAEAFGAPILLDAPVCRGSLRQAADARGIPLIVYEGGEALRYDMAAIRTGVRGVLRVLAHLGMIAAASRPHAGALPPIARSSEWIRAPVGGILQPAHRHGTQVRAGEVVAEIGDPFGITETPIVSPRDGVVIGQCHLPTVNQGEGLFHLAHLEANGAHNAAATARLHEELEWDEDRGGALAPA